MVEYEFGPFDFDYYVSRLPWAQYMWYGLLFVLMEGLTQRRVQYRGVLATEIREIRLALEAARNATFHVGREDSYWDARLTQIMSGGEAGPGSLVDRVHDGLGQLLSVELLRRLGPPEARH